MKKILVTIQGGKATVKVEGVAGDSCVAMTKKLEDNLGTVEDSELIEADYYADLLPPKTVTQEG